MALAGVNFRFRWLVSPRDAVASGGMRELRVYGLPLCPTGPRAGRTTFPYVTDRALGAVSMLTLEAPYAVRLARLEQDRLAQAAVHRMLVRPRTSDGMTPLAKRLEVPAPPLELSSHIEHGARLDTALSWTCRRAISSARTATASSWARVTTSSGAGRSAIQDADVAAPM